MRDYFSTLLIASLSEVLSICCDESHCLRLCVVLITGDKGSVCHVSGPTWRNLRRASFLSIFTACHWLLCMGDRDVDSIDGTRVS